MYLFDLIAVECFVPQHRDPKTAKVPNAQAIHPKEWENSYGMSVEEHSASTQVDLEVGYSDAITGGQDKNEQPDGVSLMDNTVNHADGTQASVPETDLVQQSHSPQRSAPNNETEENVHDPATEKEQSVASDTEFSGWHADAE